MTCGEKQFLSYAMWFERPVFQQCLSSAGSLRSRSFQPSKLSCVITRMVVKTHPRVWRHCHGTIIVFLSCNQDHHLSFEAYWGRSRTLLLQITHFLYNLNKKRLFSPLVALSGCLESFDKNIDSQFTSLDFPLDCHSQIICQKEA